MIDKMVIKTKKLVEKENRNLIKGGSNNLLAKSIKQVRIETEYFLGKNPLKVFLLVITLLFSSVKRKS